jgi:hypothetical protein
MVVVNPIRAGHRGSVPGWVVAEGGRPVEPVGESLGDPSALGSWYEAQIPCPEASRSDAREQRRHLDQPGNCLGAGAVSELQGFARFKMPSAHLLSMSDLASRGSIALR